MSPQRGDRVVVVGHGMVAVRLVELLVAGGWTDAGGSLTVLGEEPGAAYNRILLSTVLEGTHEPDAISLRDPRWYAEHGVDLRTGIRVVAIDRAARTVVTADGTRIGYDHLVLATGAIPTLPPLRGVTGPAGELHPRVHAFRTSADCARLRVALRDGSVHRAVVVGGGPLGLQVARALAAHTVVTEVVEGTDRLLSRHLGPAGATILTRALARLGTPVYTGARAVRLVATPDSGHALGVRLDNGHVLSTDLVVLTAGGRPSTALARHSGLAVGRGVIVDDQLLSVSDPAVSAIGDCAEHRGLVAGSVAPGWEQAEVVASRLLGQPVHYAGLREITRLRASDLEVAVLGDPERTSGEVVELTNPLAGSHRKLVVRDGAVVAAALVGDLSRVGLLTQYVDRGTVLGPHEPGELLLPERAGTTSGPADLPDEVEVCACAGVSAGRIRACGSLDDVRESTRATTGCGGCAPTVRALLAARAAPPAAPAPTRPPLAAAAAPTDLRTLRGRTPS